MDEAETPAPGLAGRPQARGLLPGHQPREQCNPYDPSHLPSSRFSRSGTKGLVATGQVLENDLSSKGGCLTGPFLRQPPPRSGSWLQKQEARPAVRDRFLCPERGIACPSSSPLPASLRTWPRFEPAFAVIRPNPPGLPRPSPAGRLSVWEPPCPVPSRPAAHPSPPPLHCLPPTAGSPHPRLLSPTPGAKSCVGPGPAPSPSGASSQPVAMALARPASILAQGADAQPGKSERFRSLASRPSHWPHLPFLSREAEGCRVGLDPPCVSRTTLDKATSLSSPRSLTPALFAEPRSQRKAPGLGATTDCRLPRPHCPAVPGRTQGGRPL